MGPDDHEPRAEGIKMASNKSGFWSRVAKRYQAETSTKRFRRQRRVARIQAALIGVVTVIATGIFWSLKWPVGILTALLIGAYMVIVSFVPRFIK